MRENSSATITRAEGAAGYKVPAPTNNTQALSLAYDDLRTDVDLLGADVRRDHNRAREVDLNTRTFYKSGYSVDELLYELSNKRNLLWSTIAEVSKVSVSAVRKWRTGGSPSNANKRAIARFAAMLELLEETGVITDPASWIEMDLPFDEDGYYLRPLDLYLHGHYISLLDIAERRKSVVQVLDEVMPDWRASRSRFDVYVDVDGSRSLKTRTD